MMEGLKYLCCEGKLRKLGLFSLEKRLRENLINAYKSVEGRCQEDGNRPFSVVLSNMLRVNGHKITHTEFHRICRKTSSL